MSASSKRRRQRRTPFHRRTQPGAPPGFLVPDPEAPRPDIRLYAYGPQGHVEQPVHTIAELEPYLKTWPVTWVNVDGLGDTTVISELGRLFGLHRLALEDVVHVHQRAKAEKYDDYYFLVAHMPMRNKEGWITEQVSFFLGPNYVLTFQERAHGDCFDAVRLRIRTGLSRVRGAGADHLVYALLDSIIDQYFPLLEEYAERLDELEMVTLAAPGRSAMSRIQAAKRDLFVVRRAIWPLRDALNTLLRDTTPLISDETRIYLRDCHDHTFQIIDLIETYRDLAAGLTELYLTSTSQRLNEVIKVLTIISTVFIPLTFIVGVYGMNFHYMPELDWRWGYLCVWVLMTAIAVGMFVWLYRRGWIGSPAGTEPETGLGAAAQKDQTPTG